MTSTAATQLLRHSSLDSHAHLTLDALGAAATILLPRPSRHSIKATVMRAGTSKGIYIQRDQLPVNPERWTSILPLLMGSPDPFGRQLDGLGGGTSTTSKLAITSKSSNPELADIDYLFVQASITSNGLDMTGNCGNILSGVGPYAYEEGLLPRQTLNGQVSLVLRCLNNGSRIRSTFSVQNGLPVEDGDMVVDGVSARGSPIKLDFLAPAGSMTSGLLPTGHAVDHLHVAPLPLPVEVSCVDAANPFCFVQLSSLLLPGESESDSGIDPTVLAARVESVRRAASVAMGLAKDTLEAAKTLGTPKLCLIQECTPQVGHIRTQSWSMGRPHPSLQLTGAVCVAAAIHTPGTLLHRMVARQTGGRIPTDVLKIAHPCGVIKATANVLRGPDGGIIVESATLFRTARRLFQGDAFYVS